MSSFLPSILLCLSLSGMLLLPPLYLFYRHWAVNLFLQGYAKTWISADGHSFEEQLVEDLAV